MRIEHDFLGEMAISDTQYFGIQTMRGLTVAAQSGHTMRQEAPDIIYFLAVIKKATALANAALGALPVQKCEAIVGACDEIITGKLNDQFPVDIFTGGGGITVHMNVNEVIANRANEIITGHKGYDAVHPNTHVNMGQSTNDVLPSAMLLALNKQLLELRDAVDLLHRATADKAKEFQDVVKVGRTCFQDAVPITLGQEFSGYAAFLSRQGRLLQAVAEECLVIPLGATAIGTGLGTLPGFAAAVQQGLSAMLGKTVQLSENYFDGLQNGDIYTKVSFALKTLATGLSKIAMDLRIMSSGPRAGLGEITLPQVLPGSSIMPGKINPILPELICQVCYQVCGNDVAVTMAVENSDLELNVWEAVITKCLFESCTLLKNSILVFAPRCIAGIAANQEKCRRDAENSIALAAVVAAVWGYETGSRIAKIAGETGNSIKQVVVDEGLLSAAEADELLDPLLLTKPVEMQACIKQYRQRGKISD